MFERVEQFGEECRTRWNFQRTAEKHTPQFLVAVYVQAEVHSSALHL